MQASYSGVELPKDGKPIQYSNGTYQDTRPSHHSLH